MTKRIITLLAALSVLVLLMAACSPKADEVSYEPDTSAGYRQTTLYYKNADGYIVPVVKSIPWEEGIGKAALKLLVDNESNREYLEPLGLYAAVPEGTEYSLRISENGLATVDLTDFVPCADADAEKHMVDAIVNTLTEFPTVDSVMITVAGQKKVTLPCGTVLDGPMNGGNLNAEDGEISVSTDGASPVTLYFPNKSASMNVPVTRYLLGKSNVLGALNELCKGPCGKGLLNCFPEGTEVLNANVTNGVASVEFSREFLGVENTEGLAQAAYEAVFYTINELKPISRLDLYVDGKPCGLTENMSAPVLMNGF